MLRAIIFDFNGVIVDDEPIHLKLFQQVLAEQGLPLREEDYYRVYIGMDDRECFATVLAEHGRPADSETIAALVRRKAALYQ
ncbi:MAG: HAD family phosphatase, partial [Deltaproteobacteria bacterium]|nr:HAD family phosphatase [Deltaproteobacteria bacterium]